MPLLIGAVLDKYCITGSRLIDGLQVNTYDYTLPMIIFMSSCAISIIIAFTLKRLDKQKGYGLQVANMQKKK